MKKCLDAGSTFVEKIRNSAAADWFVFSESEVV